MCFVQTPASDLRQFRYSVSMTPVHVHVTREELDMAIVSTAFAVLAVFTMLFSIPCLLARPTLYHTPVSLTAPMQPATMTLTRAQIDRVCQVAPAQPTDGSLDACAICLDDETGVSAQLPCKHRYHVLCIRGWLLRGGTTCPLCAYNLAENEDEDGDEEKDVKEGDMVRGSSRLDLLSARLSSRLSQRTSLRFRTGTGEGHGDGLSARVSARLSARLSSREGPADGSPTEMGAIGEVRLEGMSNTGPS